MWYTKLYYKLGLVLEILHNYRLIEVFWVCVRYTRLSSHIQEVRYR